MVRRPDPPVSNGRLQWSIAAHMINQHPQICILFVLYLYRICNVFVLLIGASLILSYITPIVAHMINQHPQICIVFVSYLYRICIAD